MTSELKPCPFCGGKAKLKGGRLSQENYTVWCENLHKGSANSSKEKAIAEWNTRAAPDVPELVRYKLDTYYTPAWYIKACVTEDDFGEYVSHNQAVAVIVALDNRASVAEYKLDQQVNVWQPMMQKRAEAAEAKLAKIEKQEAFGYVLTDVLEELSASGAWAVLASIRKRPYKTGGTPLYAAPVASDADLRAETIEQCRKAVRNAILRLSPEHRADGDICDDVIAHALAALNPSEPQA